MGILDFGFAISDCLTVQEKFRYKTYSGRASSVQKYFGLYPGGSRGVGNSLDLLYRISTAVGEDLV